MRALFSPESLQAGAVKGVKPNKKNCRSLTPARCRGWGWTGADRCVGGRPGDSACGPPPPSDRWSPHGTRCIPPCPGWALHNTTVNDQTYKVSQHCTTQQSMIRLTYKDSQHCTTQVNDQTYKDSQHCTTQQSTIRLTFKDSQHWTTQQSMIRLTYKDSQHWTTQQSMIRLTYKDSIAQRNSQWSDLLTKTVSTAQRNSQWSDLLTKTLKFPFHPPATTVAHKRSQSFCQKALVAGYI